MTSKGTTGRVQDVHHEELIHGIAEQMKAILDESPQAVYIYLDDVHKVCNKRFSDLLGYKNPQEWAGVDAPLDDVVDEDQDDVIAAYTRASEELAASSLEIRVRNVATEKTLRVEMIVVPVAFSGHILVMHFITPLARS